MRTNRTEGFAPTHEEAAVLVVGQMNLMRADLNAARRASKWKIKQGIYEEFAQEAVRVLAERAPSCEDVWDWTCPLSPADGWLSRLGAAVSKASVGENRARLSRRATWDTFASTMDGRREGLVVLIELCAFHPWRDGAQWSGKARRTEIAELARALPSVDQTDVEHVEDEIDNAVRQLARANRKWGRIVLLGLGGLALGVVTAGLAAPFVGGLVGGMMGFSGAVASSAGLAALGGGSLAAGGLGMAGGTALLAGCGGILGMSATSAVGHATRKPPWLLVSDAVKLQVYTRLVVLDEDHDDAMARRVVEALEQRLREVEDMIREIQRRMSAMKSENASLRGERDELKAELEALRAAQVAMRNTVRATELRLRRGPQDSD